MVLTKDKAELLEKFEQYECEPSVELFVAWLHIESMRPAKSP